MRPFLVLISICAILFTGRILKIYAEDNNEYEFQFDESEIEKKPISIGGYVELFPTLYITDEKSALYRLKYYDENPCNPYAAAYLRAQPDLILEKGIVKAFVRGYGTAGYENNGWHHDAILYEGYGTLKPYQNLAIDAGKKTQKWGKGYAWNPVAFVDRPKNTDDPELANEGYVIASADVIFSFNGPLKALAVTPVALPVYDTINDDFGKREDWNFAGKLYLLFLDTDIDFMFLAGESKGDRYGVDISRNLTSSFEIHGEYAYIPDFTKRTLDESGAVHEEEFNAYAALAGIRYLTERETTCIIEYYYNGTGMSKSEMRNYYAFIDRAYSAYLESGSEELFKRATAMAEGNYGKMSPMRNYLYLRISQKEPFDILYFTPAISSIINIDDSSFTITPELLYAGINNLELRLRYTWLQGKENSEYGEKTADHRCDLRLRYSF